MKKSMKKYISGILLLVCFITTVKAQNPMSIYYLETIPQSTFVNPAMAPRANGFFGIPGASAIYTGLSSDLRLKDFVQLDNSNQLIMPIKKEFDYNKVYNGLGNALNMGVNQSVADFVIGFRGNKGYFTFGLFEKVNSSVAVPKAFFQLVDKGLPDGTTFDFSPLGINMQYYREMNVGYSYQFSKKIRVGAHAKLLFGMAALKTDISTFDFYTSKEELSVKLEGDAYVSFPLEITRDENGDPSDVSLPETDNDFLMNQFGLNLSNPGMAFDIGAVYDYSSDWTFSGSLNDLGFIRWTGDLNSFHFNSTAEFTGLDIDGNNIDSLDNVVNSIIDTITDGIDYELGNKGFSSGLGPKLYLGAQYHVNHYLSMGALSRTTFQRNNFQQEFNLSANLNLYRFLTTTINYSLAINGTSSFGFGFAMRGGPLQFYLISDYLPARYRNYTLKSETGEESTYPGPSNFQNFNLMLGLNLVFGANGYQDAPMVDAYTEF